MLSGRQADRRGGCPCQPCFLSAAGWPIAWRGRSAANPTSGILSYTTDDYTEVEYAAPDVYQWNDSGTPDDPSDDYLELVTVSYPAHGAPATVTKYSQQISKWCSSCHERYHREKTDFMGAGSMDSGDAIFAYGHKTGDEMISATGSASCGYDGIGCHGAPERENINKQLTCLGCHVAHGTAATMTPYAQIPWPGEDATTADGLPGTAVDDWLMTAIGGGQPDDPSTPDVDEPIPDLSAWGSHSDWSTRSSLLRLDNRGVCQNYYCHQKGTEAWLEGHAQGLDY